MNKVYLNSLIILTIIAIFIAIFGTSNHFMSYYNPTKDTSSTAQKDPEPTPTPTPNPDPEPKPADKDKEISGYKCKYENCQILDGTSIINNQYLFIVDGVDNVVLFDTESKEIIETYKSVIPAGSSYIAKDQNDKYGIINVNTKLEPFIAFDFTFIEYKKDKEQFILTKDNNSYVADNKGNKVTLTYNAQIIEYNDLYIVTRTSSNQYHIFNYNNSVELTEYVNSKRVYIELVSEYVGVISDDYMYRLYDFRNGTKLITEYQLEQGTTQAHASINSKNQLEITANDRVIKTLEL